MKSSDKHGLSRRTVLKTGAVTGVAAASGLATAGTAAAATGAGGTQTGGLAGRTSPAGDLILFNGRIHTMDGANTVASVVAIRQGFVVYVGNNVGIARQQFTSQPQAIDLHGRMAVPGLIDCHNHIVLMGNRPGHHTPLENARNIADVQALYAARAATLPPSPNPPVSAADFITTIGGFSTNQFAETRLPTLTELDAAVPDHPVYLSIGFTGPSATNTLGKAFFENVPPPVGPITVGADGSIAASPFLGTGPTGQATLALRQTLTFDDRKRSVRDAMAYAASVGVTTHLDQGAFQAANTPADGSAHEDNYTMYLPFLSVYEEGEQRDVENAVEAAIRLRTNYLLFDSDPSIPVATARIQNAFPFFGNDLVRTGAAGEFLADIFHYAGGNSTWMNAGLAAAKAGWRAEVHSLTPADFQSEIAGFEAINAQFPITGLRWVVAHVPFITADYVARLQALGGGVNLTPYEYFGTANPAGPPYRMLVDSG
ncbi:MAG: amidohydrolase family protein, partial [Actinobacteria bacterium]|nr:amidohydrolase family protein [Actinomycetota bacterium]